MANQHTLQKILDQIAEHKVQLREVDDKDMDRVDEEPERKPLEKVDSVFSDESLEKRAEQNPTAENLEPVPPPEPDQIGHPSHTPVSELPPEVKDSLEKEKEFYEFRSVFDFKDFILMFYESFDDFQKAALNSIVTVCDTIEVGCKCKKGSRLKIAEDYYIQFAMKNQESGLIEKFKKILNAKKIKFYSKDKLVLEK